MDTEEHTAHVLIGCKGCMSPDWAWGTLVREDEHGVCRACKRPQPPNQYVCYSPDCQGDVVLRHEQ